MAERTFERVTLAQFVGIVAEFPWTRRILEVHLHHTWRPRKDDFRGLRTILAMWEVHTQDNHWSDIAQHVTVDPEGGIWLCRNFNAKPASAVGFNGNKLAGPFMIEMIGDFDVGRDVLEGDQRAATVGVIKAVQGKFGLPATALSFHNELSSKSCPGSGIGKGELIRAIEAARLPDASRSANDGPFPSIYTRRAETIDALRFGPKVEDSEDGEHEEHGGHAEGGARGARMPSIDEIIDVVEDHVVNLENGEFSDSGQLLTTDTEVDRIFDVLGRWVEGQRAAGRPANILLWAHGGLVSESNALGGAYRMLPFWKKNDVYPLFFVWETGLGEIIRQMLDNALQRLGLRRERERGLLDSITDNAIEELIRALHGRMFWDAMKSSARRASEAGGGGAYVANKLATLLSDHRDARLHAAGHSAGSIFVAHLLGALSGNGVFTETVHFLAPAIRNDLFHGTVAPLLGDRVGHLAMFTMKDRLERADNTAVIYRKSLLYLVSEAFERERHASILGMEVKLRADREAAELFGLRGRPSLVADVVFSESGAELAGSGCTARSHPGFDDDPPTVNSVARRILGKVNGEPIEDYQTTAARVASRGSVWEGQTDIPPSLAARIKAAEEDEPGPVLHKPGKSEWYCPPGGGTSGPAAAPQPSTQADAVSGSGTRKALCVGIDRYTGINPLGACVADARLWRRTLEGRGYQVTMLLDEEATAPRLRAEVQRLVDEARTGDNLVFTFSGHGTFFEDLDGDEGDAHDECLCTVECGVTGSEGLVIDDELRRIFAGLPNGAQITAFTDSCHSGTVTRARARARVRLRARGVSDDRRVRFASPTETMRRAYRNRLAVLTQSRAPTVSQRRDVLFSACTADQQAIESGGHGHFTRHATDELASATSGVTNADFVEAVLRRFGEDAETQTPQLDCELDVRASRLLIL